VSNWLRGYSPPIKDECLTFFSTSCIPEFNFAFPGKENEAKITIKATQNVVKNWPKSVPIIFNGYEFGSKIQTGWEMIEKMLKGSGMGKNPCADAYVYYCENSKSCTPGKGRSSWDLITVLHAVFLENPEGWEELVGGNRKSVALAARENWETFVPWKSVKGKNFVRNDGHNMFVPAENFEEIGLNSAPEQFYLKVKGGDGQYDALEIILDELLS
jgi:hypothetical protein